MGFKVEECYKGTQYSIITWTGKESKRMEIVYVLTYESLSRTPETQQSKIKFQLKKLKCNII